MLLFSTPKITSLEGPVGTGTGTGIGTGTGTGTGKAAAFTRGSGALLMGPPSSSCLYPVLLENNEDEEEVRRYDYNDTDDDESEPPLSITVSCPNHLLPVVVAFFRIDKLSFLGCTVPDLLLAVNPESVSGAGARCARLFQSAFPIVQIVVVVCLS